MTSGHYAVIGTYGSFINPLVTLSVSQDYNELGLELLVNNEDHIWYLNANNEVVAGDAVSDGNAVLTVIQNAFTSFYEIPTGFNFELNGLNEVGNTPTIIGNLCE